MALKRVLMPFLFVGLLAAGACGPAGSEVASRPSPAYAQLLQTLYRHTVPTVASAVLVRELSEPAAPLLLDARTPAEYQVSHLQGARFINYDSVATVQLPGVDRSRPVVVYCSVGCRSERLGERLQALGFQYVHNLYGGLFEWVNEGYPVYNAGGLTSDVHPYSLVWSPWLKRGRKVYK
ncbi:MAG: hypothetical protein NVS3B25_16240 [Hymenobacter sp.]